MALFPSNPSDGQILESANQVYFYDDSIGGWRKTGSAADERAVAATNDIRIELSSTLYDQTRILRSGELWLHSVKPSGRIGLYNGTTRRWSLRQAPASAINRTLGTIVPNRVHDVYIFDATPNSEQSDFQIELLAWQDNSTVPVREYRAGVPVRSGFNERRLIGTVLTSVTDQSEVENRRGGPITKLNAVENAPRMGFHNLYNSIRTEYKMSLTDSFGRNTNGDWESPNGYNDQAIITTLSVVYLDGIISANTGGTTTEHRFALSAANSLSAPSPYSDTLTKPSTLNELWINSGSVSVNQLSMNLGVRTYAYLYSQNGAGSENAVVPGAGMNIFVNQ